MAAVVLESQAKVPAISGFAVPGCAVRRAVVHKGFAAWWGDQVAVVVVVPEKVLVGRELEVQL